MAGDKAMLNGSIFTPQDWCGIEPPDALTPARAKHGGLHSGAQLGTLVRSVLSIVWLPDTWPSGTSYLLAFLTTLAGLQICPYVVSFYSFPTLAFDSD